jgi:CheY-like chemotaxis protein
VFAVGLPARLQAWQCPTTSTLTVSAEGILIATILIVEDDVYIRQIAVMMVEDMGHTTLSASGMDEAIAVLKSGESIDALFSDVRLNTARLGGFEVARCAVEARPGLRVLYTTANTVTPEMSALFVEDALFLSKPYSEDQLQAALNALFDAKPSLEPA